ncbi:MAG: hypothetical protein JNL69_04545, partial [Bacteroidia bacterium]|nr:hypothetical protein [Bacteroidia bacterium]
NTIELNSETFIQCDLVHYKSGKSAFVLSWDHILMDGRGAGILIKHLSSVHYFNANDLHHFFPKEETKVSIYQYIKNMYKVKHFIEKSSKAPIASVTQKIENEGIPLYHTLVFEKEIVEQIEKNAVKKGARFGLNLFLIASCAHVVNKLNKKRNSVGDLWFPIPYDGRLRGAKGPIVTNNVSTLFYRFSQTDLNSIEKTIESLNKQMAEQLKMEMPKKYNMLLNMMRHIPNRLYYFLVNRSSEGSFASFLYTSTGENIQHMEQLFDKQIENVQIYPQHTYPPGLTFSFLRFNGSIRLNFAYISTSISEKELEEMKNNLNKILLD